ncbi:MAG: type II secretion system major pseudopilin GspG [Planctomycetota bacterium]
MKIREGQNRLQRGFTLVEIMVVIVILGLLVAIVAPNVLGSQSEAELGIAKTTIKSLEDQVKQYAIFNRRIPTMEDLLEEDEKGRTYLEGYTEPPDDPWGNAYEIRELEGRLKFEVISYGPDGEPDTEDDLSSMRKN